MHAGIPCLPTHLSAALRDTTRSLEIPDVGLERVKGTLLAGAIEFLLEAGFGAVTFTDKTDLSLLRQGGQFFEENFEIIDANVDGGKRYYQGKFLLRTDKADDDMNVYVEFCPDPSQLFFEVLGEKFPDPTQVVRATSLDEMAADRLERDPSRVDLVIRFRDIQSILDLAAQPDADVVGLLLDNVVRLTGNLGHLFKLGAIAADLRR
jgi:hypothetical protein